MQSVSSRIWTCFAVSISYDDNHYTVIVIGTRLGLLYGIRFWLGLVLWHTNHCWLFYAKPFSYVYVEYMISKHILLITFLNEPELIFFVHS